MTECVTLVCGFGRCGSSLVMQMLAGGRMPVTGGWPSFEAPEASLSGFDGPWIAAQLGGAVKVLDPHRPEIEFAPGAYRSIWLDRNPVQQARSQLKFLQVTLGVGATRQHRQLLCESYSRDRPAARAKLQVLGPMLTLRFESLLQHPDHSARRLAAFCDLPDAGALARMVIQRSPRARPDMAIELAQTKALETVLARQPELADG